MNAGVDTLLQRAAVCVGVVALGCSSSRTDPLFEGPDSNGFEFFTDASPNVPEAGPPDARAADATPPLPRTCRVVVRQTPVVDVVVRQPIVDGRAVYAHQIDLEGRVEVVDLVSGERVGKPDDRLIDAADGAKLLQRIDANRGALLVYRDANREDVLSDTWNGSLPFGPRSRTVGRERAIWVETARPSVRVWQRDTPFDLVRGEASWIALDPENFAWLDPFTSQLGFSASDGDVRRVDMAPGSLPSLGRGHVWFSDAEQRLMHLRFGQPPTAVGLEGCTAIAAYEDEALAVCGSDQSELHRLRARPDGVEATLLRDGRVFDGLGIGPSGLAWAEYDSTSDLCDGTAVGTLRWWPQGEPEPIFVATIGSGCLCCGAFWAPIAVEVGDELLAWNYAGKRFEPTVGIAERLCD